MRVAVTGGRDHWLSVAELAALDALWLRLGATELVHGACPTGVDKDVDSWGLLRGLTPTVDLHRFPVNEAVDGRWPAAGPRRNGRMLKVAAPSALIAFKGGRGTADCTKQARRRGITIYEVTPSGKVIPPAKERP